MLSLAFALVLLPVFFFFSHGIGINGQRIQFENKKSVSCHTRAQNIYVFFYKQTFIIHTYNYTNTYQAKSHRNRKDNMYIIFLHEKTNFAIIWQEKLLSLEFLSKHFVGKNLNKLLANFSFCPYSN